MGNGVVGRSWELGQADRNIGGLSHVVPQGRRRWSCKGRGAGGLIPWLRACRGNSSFWTRTALVMTLALSVMATALFVLKLYHATVFEEATGLGQSLRDEISRSAELEMMAFLGDMVPSVLMLGGILQRQGLGHALARDPHDARARAMLWEIFKEHPLAERLTYESDRGVLAYSRFASESGRIPMLIEAHPESPALPYENWTAQTLPVDPLLGEPLSRGAPIEPVAPYNLQQYYRVGMRKPSGSVNWWIGPRASETGEAFMYYIATCVLTSVMPVGSPPLLPAADAGTRSANQTNGESQKPAGNVPEVVMNGTSSGGEEVVMNGTSSGGVEVVTDGTSSGGVEVVMNGISSGGVDVVMNGTSSGNTNTSAQNDGGGVGTPVSDDDAMSGDAVTPPPPPPSTPSPPPSTNTDGGTGSVSGLLTLAYSTRSLSEALRRLKLRGGRVFFSRPGVGTMVIANQGRLFYTGEGPGQMWPTPATSSDDPVIHAAAEHLTEEFMIPRGFVQEFWGDQPPVVMSEDELNARASGLCWQSYGATISVNGRRWYLYCEGKVYGGPAGRLPLVGVLLIPRDAIMGRVDHSQRRSLSIIAGVTVAIVVLGMAFVYFSTVHVGRIARKKEELEGQVERQEGEIKSMVQELDEMRALLPQGPGHVLDMRTPMEKVHDLLGELTEGHANGPEAKVLATIQRLLRMPEPHVPLALQKRLGIRQGTGPSGAAPQGAGVLDDDDVQILDDDTTAWLRSTVMRLPGSVPTKTSDISPEGSVTINMDLATQSMHNDGSNVPPGHDSSRRDQTHGSVPPPQPTPRLGEGAGDEILPGTRSSTSGHISEQTLSAAVGESVGGLARQSIDAMQPGAMLALVGEEAGPRAGVMQAGDRQRVRSATGDLEEGDKGRVPPTTMSSAGSFTSELTTIRASDFSPNISPNVAYLDPGPSGDGLAEGPQGQLRALLGRAGEWNFDTWQLSRIAGGRPITWMGMEAFQRTLLVRHFRLPKDKLLSFLAALEEGMLPNGYHNSTHIADVTNGLLHLLKHSGLAKYLTRLDVLAVVTAALLHDFRHPGLNNDFVVKSSNELALRYNDLTVLENYHVAEGFILLADVSRNFLEVLGAEDYRYVRRMIIEIVLASDLKRHFELVEAFKTRTKDKESPLSKKEEGHRLLLMQIALKVADIGHAAKKLDIHKQWTAAITEEFYLQGDKERAAGLKVSPFMDRETNNLAKSQLGFFSYIAFPLFEAWVAAFPASRPIMEAISANIKYWEKQRDAAVG
eukprot:jgi/Mesvir1/27408/Mv07207-RA.3